MNISMERLKNAILQDKGDNYIASCLMAADLSLAMAIEQRAYTNCVDDHSAVAAQYVAQAKMAVGLPVAMTGNAALWPITKPSGASINHPLLEARRAKLAALPAAAPEQHGGVSQPTAPAAQSSESVQDLWNAAFGRVHQRYGQPQPRLSRAAAAEIHAMDAAIQRPVPEQATAESQKIWAAAFGKGEVGRNPSAMAILKANRPAPKADDQGLWKNAFNRAAERSA